MLHPVQAIPDARRLAFVSNRCFVSVCVCVSVCVPLSVLLGH